ncbi:MAG: aminoacyl-tRNA hydrolase [Verrucomicrobia bacterium]|nr:aminoacyl-tRNA hydrolase [Verrucomicrobiota bacterium]
MENCHLIVGLGNPGLEYRATRHNAGFALTDKLAERWRAGWVLEKKFQARLARGELNGRKWILCQPQTFMNLSGEAVGAVRNYFQIASAGLLVAVDDADLPLGEIRLRARGSSGGHHGLESIEQQLGTRDFARLRLGIGRQEREAGRQIRDYVLGRFGVDEQARFQQVLARAAEQVECWMDAGIQLAMTKFNGAIAAT